MAMYGPGQEPSHPDGMMPHAERYLYPECQGLVIPQAQLQGLFPLVLDLEESVSCGEMVYV
jgi:hypothetical protein